MLIIGAGPVGCLHARLGLAAALVAPEAAIDAVDTDLVGEVMRLTGGRGADVVIVCAASGRAQQQAVRMAARRGRVSLFAGLPKGSNAVSLDTSLIHYREVRLVGAAGATLPRTRRRWS